MSPRHDIDAQVAFSGDPVKEIVIYSNQYPSDVADEQSKMDADTKSVGVSPMDMD